MPKDRHLPRQVIHDRGERHKLGVVPNFVGHGVGWHFHSAPVVQHVRNREPGVMVPGQTFTIEPMLTEGTTRGKVRPALHEKASFSENMMRFERNYNAQS